MTPTARWGSGSARPNSRGLNAPNAFSPGSRPASTSSAQVSWLLEVEQPGDLPVLHLAGEEGRVGVEPGGPGGEPAHVLLGRDGPGIGRRGTRDRADGRQAERELQGRSPDGMHERHDLSLMKQ